MTDVVTLEIDRRARRHHRKIIVQSLVSFMAWLLLLLFAATFVFSSYSRLAHITVVSGTSMEPTYKNGDIIIAFKEDSYSIGDNIVFQPDEVEASCPRCHIVHRIVEINEQGQYMTRGDNNDFNDQWWLNHSEVLGAERFHLNTGEIGTVLFSVTFWFFILSVLLLLFTLVTIWHWVTRKEDETEAEKLATADIPLDEIYYEDLIHTADAPPKKAKLLMAARHTPDVVGLSVVLISIMVAVLGASAATLSLTSAPLQVGTFPWTWTAPPPEPPPGPINPPPSAPFNFTVTYSQPNGQQVCANIVVSTTSTTPVPWSATLRVTGSPFNGDTRAQNYQFNPNGQYGFTSNQVNASGNFIIEGRGVRANVVAGQDRVFSICNYSTPFPQGRASGVTYTVAPGNGSNYTVAPGFYVCQQFTVTTSGATQFFVGWDAVIDATPLANAYFTQTGQIGEVKGPFGGYSRVSQGNNQFLISGTGWDTAGIKDGIQQQFSVCWGA